MSDYEYLRLLLERFRATAYTATVTEEQEAELRDLFDWAIGPLTEEKK